MVYKIYEEFISDVEKKLKRVEKKCIKNGNKFVYKKIGETIEKIKDENGNENYYKFINIEVEGTAKIDDWECVAILEVFDEGNIIKKINTNIEIPKRFRNTKNICEHCNSKRFRNKLYIIHNTKTDEWKQVGSTCVILYTHGLNAEYITAYIDGITELGSYNNYINISCRQIYPVKKIIECAYNVINKIGYFNSNSKLPTKTIVNCIICGRIDNLLKYHNLQFDFDNLNEDDVEKNVNEIIEYYKNQIEDNDFIHNVKVILKNEYVYMEDIGYLCYLPEGYNRFKEREKTNKLLETNELYELYGEVGKRYKDVPVKYIKLLNSFMNDFGGFNYLCKVVLEDNHVLIWNGTKFNEEKIPKFITFTVKEHNEYKGKPQTKITRCKIKYE